MRVPWPEVWLTVLAIGAPTYLWYFEASLRAEGQHIPPLWFQFMPLALIALCGWCPRLYRAVRGAS